MLTKRNALLAAGVAVLIAVAGERTASASDWNWKVDKNGNVPWDAIQGGLDTNGHRLFFCRSFLEFLYGFGKQPGKVSQDLGGCRYGFAGMEHSDTAAYEVLVPHWESGSNGGVPPGSFRAGNDTDGTTLYFCRASHLGGLHPGKLKKGAGCYIGYGGSEVLLKNYEALQDDLPMSAGNDDFAGGFIIGGYEANQTFYLDLCVANYNNSRQPGKVVSSESCHFSYRGREVSTNDFSFLTLHDTHLLFTPLASAFVAGQDANGQPLYACSTRIGEDNGGSIQLGKFRQDFFGCHVGWGGNEVTGNAADFIVD